MSSCNVPKKTATQEIPSANASRVTTQPRKSKGQSFVSSVPLGFPRSASSPTGPPSAYRQLPRTGVLLALLPSSAQLVSGDDRNERRNENLSRTLFLHTLILTVDLDDPLAEGIGDIEITRSVQSYAYRNIQAAFDCS